MFFSVNFFLLGLSYQTWIPFCEIFLKSKKRIIENNLLTSWQQYHYFTGGHICLGRLTVILFIKHLTPGFITSPKSYFLLSGKLNFNIKALQGYLSRVHINQFLQHGTSYQTWLLLLYLLVQCPRSILLKVHKSTLREEKVLANHHRIICKMIFCCNMENIKKIRCQRLK